MATTAAKNSGGRKYDVRRFSIRGFIRRSRSRVESPTSFEQDLPQSVSSANDENMNQDVAHKSTPRSIKDPPHNTVESKRNILSPRENVLDSIRTPTDVKETPGTINAPPKAPEITKSLTYGASIGVKGGKYNQQHGTFVRATPKCYVVKIDGKDVTLAQDRIHLLESEAQAPNVDTFIQQEIQTQLITDVVVPDVDVGCKVEIVAGKNKGKRGVVISTTPKMCTVQIFPGQQVNVMKKSVIIDSWENVPVPGDAAPAAGPEANELVEIIAGKHKTKLGHVVSTTEKMMKVRLRDGNEVSIRKTSARSAKGTIDAPASVKTSLSDNQDGRRKSSRVISSHPLSRPSNEQISEPQEYATLRVTGRTSVGSQTTGRLVQVLDFRSQDHTILTHCFGERLKVELRTGSSRINPDQIFEDSNSRYQLVTVKYEKDENQGYTRKDTIKCQYFQASGPSSEPFNIEEFLQGLANFAAISSPAKLVSRLELLASPAFVLKGKPAIFETIRSQNVVIVDIPGIDGCGFISESLLERLLCELGMGKTDRSRAVAIQVRMLVPSKGLFKGMLIRKRVLTGDTIEVPRSMLKVPPSPLSNVTDGVVLLINKNGIYPAGSDSTVFKVGRILRGHTYKTFDPKPMKKSSEDMILRLWRGLGVDEDTIEQYRKNTNKKRKIKHCYMVGVADPTSSLPAGHIFVPGMGSEHGQHSELFVARSPCLTQKGGRVLPVVTSRPQSMAEEDWKWLNELSFSVIIFANPTPGKKPLPSYVSNGDLDGDYYFVCWDDEIIQKVDVLPIEDEPLVPDEPIEVPDSPVEAGWLSKAHDIMTDTKSRNDIQKLIADLYSLSTKAADASPDFLRDPDAEAFAEAYENALDYAKHRRPISLPLHLHTMLSIRLRQYVTSSAEV